MEATPPEQPTAAVTSRFTPDCVVTSIGHCMKARTVPVRAARANRYAFRGERGGAQRNAKANLFSVAPVTARANSLTCGRQLVGKSMQAQFPPLQYQLCPKRAAPQRKTPLPPRR